MEYKYKFSVIIPIYNVEDYLAETIESVINQTIGFDCIQIILVNDGSPDNSEEICLKYQEQYPNNIKYIKKENGGVSSARNLGIEYAEGKYINFLDSDDKWESDVFEKAYNMFEQNDDLDIIGVRQKFFEAASGYPSLDYKFNRDKIVSIFEDYNHIQLSATSAFIRESSIGNIRYDTKVKYSEDAKFLNEIIIKNGKLGIISSSVHLYRKRFSENSAIQVKNTKDDWYLITPLECYMHAFELSRQKFGYVIDYFQYYVAYDYQFRMKERIPSNISQETINKYFEITHKLFSEIEDYIILDQRNLYIEYKIEFLRLKYNRDIRKEFKYVNHFLYFNGYKIIQLNNAKHLKVNTIDFDEKYIKIIGTLNFPIPEDDYELYAVINNKARLKVNLETTRVYERKAFNKVFIANRGFVVNIPIDNFKTFYFEFVYKKYYITKMRLSFGLNAKLTDNTKNYYINNGYVYYYYNKLIKRKPLTIKNKFIFELRYVANLIKVKKVNVLFNRFLYKICKLFNKKKIWLISDRPLFAANDNGFRLFEYICKQNDKNIKPYFIIKKDLKDYNKVKSIGKTIIFNSLKYKIYFLLADKVISSQADDWTTNPFGKEECYYRDLFNYDFVFLQHGITKDDISNWLNIYAKNIKLFITSTEKEYNSLLNVRYGYDKNIVKLTGLPRYDKLEDKKKKLIAIMPTWRLDLANNVNEDGVREYSLKFKGSEYYKFFNTLINDERLLSILKKYNYKGLFVMHPSHSENYVDFLDNDICDVIDGTADYQEIFKTASLLITDYSSVAFDFAYLNKPVLYTQFDKKSFFEKHLYIEGYFSYEKDGFGPVVYDYDSTVNEIIKFIENDCKLDKKYEKRIDKFYKYRDKNNCKRVYEEIKKLDEK